MSEFTSSIVLAMLHATIFFIVASGIYFIARRSGPEIGSRVAFIALVAVALLGVTSLIPWDGWGWAPWTRDADSSVAASTAAVTTNAIAQTAASRERAPVVERDSLRFEVADVPARLLPSAESVRGGSVQDVMGRQSSTFAWQRMFLPLFLSGLVGVTLWRLAGLWSLTRQVASCPAVADPRMREDLDVLQARLGVSGTVRLVESASIQTPATVGWCTPTILLPRVWRRWTEVERKVILAHELAHIACGRVSNPKHQLCEGDRVGVVELPVGQRSISESDHDASRDGTSV